MSNIIFFDNSQIDADTPTNVRRASFKPQTNSPIIMPSAVISSLAAISGNVTLGKRAMLAPGASVRGYADRPVWVGNDVCIQDGAVLHGLQSSYPQELIEETVVDVDGKVYGVYIEDRVTLSHQSQVHGPACIGSDTFIGMQSLVFRAIVGEQCVIEPKALVMGVQIGDGRYVPAGAIITTQADADELPLITRDYTFKSYARTANTSVSGSQAKPNSQTA